ncbi:unnamed protein product [Pleuronectes platessa]|uniref:Uncharacterized protein n=1 Tax=Pleuronectes platessa TaxID=8262 RepID=A0A9N7VPW8_PLEPL|nr:unnamed protein product [Pleuronectes platessa]
MSVSAAWAAVFYPDLTEAGRKLAKPDPNPIGILFFVSEPGVPRNCRHVQHKRKKSRPPSQRLVEARSFVIGLSCHPLRSHSVICLAPSPLQEHFPSASPSAAVQLTHPFPHTPTHSLNPLSPPSPVLPLHHFAFLPLLFFLPKMDAVPPGVVSGEPRKEEALTVEPLVPQH